MMTIAGTLLWLSLNIYHEARSENQASQVAVAHVTINRSKANNKTIKEVVFQPHQFSWTTEKRKKVPKDTKIFKDCVHSAVVALSTPDTTGGSTFYHERHIKPYWAKHMKYTKTVGNHKFYKKKADTKLTSKASKKNYHSRKV